MVAETDVEFLHEEFVTKSNESRRNIKFNLILQKSALINLIKNLLVGVVSSGHVRMIASSNMETNEVLQGEKGLI